MANDIQGLKQSIRSTVAAVHSINDDPSLLGNDDPIMDGVVKDLPSAKGAMPKQLSDLKSKLKNKPTFEIV